MAMNKQELCLAFREAASSEFAQIPRDDSQIQHIFSDDFDDRMNSLIKQIFDGAEKPTNDLTEHETH